MPVKTGLSAIGFQATNGQAGIRPSPSPGWGHNRQENKHSKTSRERGAAERFIVVSFVMHRRFVAIQVPSGARVVVHARSKAVHHTLRSAYRDGTLIMVR